MRIQNILIVVLAVALANARFIEDVENKAAGIVSDAEDISAALNVPSYLKIPTAIKKYSLNANPDEDIAAADNEEYEYDEEDVIDDKEIAEEDTVAMNVPQASLRKGNILDDDEDVSYADADENIVYVGEADENDVAYADNDEIDEAEDEFDNIPAVERTNIILSASDDDEGYEYDEEDVIDDKGVAEVDNDNDSNSMNVPQASLRKGNTLDDDEDVSYADADENIVYVIEKDENDVAYADNDEIDEAEEFDNIPAVERTNIILSASDDYVGYDYDEVDVIDDKGIAEVDNDNDSNSMNVPQASLRKGNALDDDEDVAYADDDEDVAYADADENIVYVGEADENDVAYADNDEIDEAEDEFDNIPAVERTNIILSASDDDEGYEYDEEDTIDDKGVAEEDNDSNNSDPYALKVPAEYVQKYASKYADVEGIDEDVVNADDEDVAYADADEDIVADSDDVAAADEVGDVVVDEEGIEGDIPASIKAAFLRKYKGDRAEEVEEDVAAETGEELNISPPLKIVGDYINENGEEDVANADENEEYVTLRIPKSYLKGELASFAAEDANVVADDVDAAEAENVVKSADAEEVKEIIEEVEEAPITQKIAAALKAPSEFINKKLENEAKAEAEEEDIGNDEISQESPVKIAAALRAPSAFIDEADGSDFVAAEGEIDDTIKQPNPEKTTKKETIAAGAVGAIGAVAAAAGVFFWVKKSKKRDIKDIEEVIRMKQMNNIIDYEDALKMEQANVKFEN